MILSVYDDGFDRVIDKALNTLFSKKVDVYTFAFYYDHEGHAVEILADTKTNSDKQVYKSHRFASREFVKAIQAKDLEKAARWGSSNDRNYSLGDFHFKGLAREPVKAPNNSAPFFLAMLNAIRRNSKKIAALSSQPQRLVYLCSSRESEIGFVWREPS